MFIAKNTIKGSLKEMQWSQKVFVWFYQLCAQFIDNLRIRSNFYNEIIVKLFRK